jgi:hypothetical protein
MGFLDNKFVAKFISGGSAPLLPPAEPKSQDSHHEDTSAASMLSGSTAHDVRNEKSDKVKQALIRSNMSLGIATPEDRETIRKQAEARRERGEEYAIHLGRMYTSQADPTTRPSPQKGLRQNPGRLIITGGGFMG